MRPSEFDQALGLSPRMNSSCLVTITMYLPLMLYVMIDIGTHLTGVSGTVCFPFEVGPYSDIM